MKIKNSIILGFLSLFMGFIPLSFKNKKDITYTIYAENIVSANQIKEELIVFYKEYCYSFSFQNITKNIEENIKNFKYDCTYNNYKLIIHENNYKIKMTGYLFKNNPLEIDFKYLFFDCGCFHTRSDFN